MSTFRARQSIEEQEHRLGQRLFECLTELSDVSDDFEAKRYAQLADGLRKAAKELWACEQEARNLAWLTRLHRNNTDFKPAD